MDRVPVFETGDAGSIPSKGTMKIGILGGSFDPPHFGHLSISKQVKTVLGLDEIWLMPCYKHAFQKNLSSVEHRVAMAKFLESDGIKVSEYEIAQNKQSFTVDTLAGLTNKFPEHVFYWIMGSDQIESLRKYKNWQEIVGKYNLIIFPRVGFDLKSVTKNVIVLESEGLALNNISSTNIRERVRDNEAIGDMVPKGIEEYIKKHGLYKNQRLKTYSHKGNLSFPCTGESRR